MKSRASPTAAENTGLVEVLRERRAGNTLNQADQRLRDRTDKDMRPRSINGRRGARLLNLETQKKGEAEVVAIEVRR